MEFFWQEPRLRQVFDKVLRGYNKKGESKRDERGEAKQIAVHFKGRGELKVLHRHAIHRGGSTLSQQQGKFDIIARLFKGGDTSSRLGRNR